MRPINIKILDIVGKTSCVSANEGQLVYDKIIVFFRQGKQINLSFDHIEILIPAFLNAAIGQLYSEFSSEQIRDLISVVDIEQEDIHLLRRVVDNAKVYFEKPRENPVWDGETGDEEDE